MLDGGAVPVPVLGRSGLARRGHVQVRQDEAVAVDRISPGEIGDRQGALAGVQGAAPPRPGVARCCVMEKVSSPAAVLGLWAKRGDNGPEASR